MSFKSRFQWGMLFFILFICGAFYMQSNHEFALTQRAMTEISEGVQQGNKASPFSLKNLDGSIINLEDFHEKKVVLFFFSTWCHVCGEQWGPLEAAKEQGMLEDVEIIAVNLTKEERSVEDVQGYVDAIPMKEVTFLLDEEGYTQNLYQVIGIPTILFIDDSRKIVSRNHGLVSLEQMKEISIFN